MIVARETLADVLPELGPVIHRNWEESAADHDGAPLDPAWDRYLALERAGALRLFTARRADDALIGGALFTVGRSLHSQNVTLATCDTIWLAPEHRRGMAGARLLKIAEGHLAAEGVDKMVVSVKPNGVGMLLSRMGYEPVERVFVRKLEKTHG